MDTKYDFTQHDADRIVYVRPVDAEDLPAEVQDQLGGLKTLYAVHNALGERLALVKDRNLAFQLARQNDFAPVTVH
ncbi:DUF1150 domain-containing protein [Citreicella sp. C3M06]|uniref:DUF1150 family protein n=1 Tax=Roseobacteraceae TaxID=2854170 RepID=UPI001C081E11|nr:MULTISPECIES: DUF1150 family protein [Roseobacteraceae]MBU2962537.1 DUF1150 domain-containing protein [Citreicella sp. C3M06]MDO6585411.1 DUF1150 family protein [Salipiger sp. 1_MG-2023]